MSSTTTTKVTSLGSCSEIPTVPNPTPATEALDDAVVNAPPPMDFAAVTRILAPITEDLNESAEVAMLPSPPINTPISMSVVGSPTPSMSYRFPIRARGISIIGDRLAQLKIEDRLTHRHHRGTDVTSSSRSAEPSVAEECEECEMASISEVLSDDCKEKECPSHGALGSPAVNPRIEEYLSFTSKDLPTQAPPPATGAKLDEHVSSTSTTALDADSLRSRVSFKSDGVTEKSNWAEELEDSVDRTCLRLEQLAKDEHNEDPSKSAEYYYLARLNRLLGDRKKRQVPVKIAGVAKYV